MRNLNDKNYDAVLNEAYDVFQSQGISIIGEGFKEVASDPALFNSYVDTLTEGVSANSQAVMAELMVNTNKTMLMESSMTGIQPIASLSMPVIRKLWPKFALKDALKTIVAKSPRFVVSYTKPYLVKGDNEKIYLPRGLSDSTGALSDAGKKTFLDATDAEDVTIDGLGKKRIVVEAGSALTVNFNTAIANTPSAAKKQAIDELHVVELHVRTGTGTEGDAFVYKPVKIYKRKADIGGTQVHELGDGAQLIIKMDAQGAKATLASIGATAVLVLKAGVATEYNEDHYSVGFDIDRKDIDIPTGLHINAPLPVEALQDMMALYNIDGTKETVELMTNVFSQRLDLEVLDFISKSFVDQPNYAEFSGNEDSASFLGTFNTKPAAGFALSPRQWREELKTQIDYLATRVKNATYLQAGMFSIVGNPLDIQLITNIDWSFRGGQGNTIDGVVVDYSVGTFVSANTYKIISSPNVPQGSLYILFIPANDKQLTYAYYPYSFSTETQYVDANRSRVPSIMMTKRHTFTEFMPAIAMINIEDNDGQPYNEGNVNTKEW